MHHVYTQMIDQDADGLVDEKDLDKLLQQLGAWPYIQCSLYGYS